MEMPMIILERWYRPDCALGIFTINNYRCFSLELPDRDNQQDISCIPEGVYQYEIYESPSKGTVLLILDVKGRTMIEVHSGNFTYQILGCILVGESIKFLDSDSIPDVTSSRNTLKKVLKLAGKSGTIQIRS